MIEDTDLGGSGNESFDEFIEYLKSLPDANKVSILNQARVEQMEFVYRIIKKVLISSGCDAKVICKQSEFSPSRGVVEVEGINIELADGKWFSRAAEFANNIEVYPLSDNRVRMTFMFKNLTIPIQ